MISGDRAKLYLDIDGVFLVGNVHESQVAPFNDATEFDFAFYSRRVVGEIGRIAQDHAQPRWLSTWCKQSPQVGEEFGWQNFPYLEDDNLGQPGERAIDWKYRVLQADVGDDPFVWVDDKLNDKIISDAKTRFAQPHLLVQPDAAQGLTEDDITTIEKFLINQQ